MTSSGVMDAVTANDGLLWFRHEGRHDGTVDWWHDSGRRVGVGWGIKQIFSG